MDETADHTVGVIYQYLNFTYTVRLHSHIKVSYCDALFRQL